jgi:flavin-dependent dehydrogenase
VKRFDVVVVGGGPAGNTLGLLLARSGCSVALLERTDHTGFRIGESLPPAVEPRLRRLALWERFLETTPQPVAGVLSAWGSDELDSSSFISNPYQDGWHVERSSFDAMLCLAAQDAGVQVMRRNAVRRVLRTGSGRWLVTAESLTGEWQFETPFLVDASGRSARISSHLRVGRHQVDNLLAVAVLFSRAASAGFPSLVEARPEGWWYSAGLPDNQTAVIFFTDSDICSRSRLTDFRNWERILSSSRYTRERLRGCEPLCPLRVFPAATHRLESTIGNGWLAVGDAAAARDPLSSSGVDFALASAERAFSALQAIANGDSHAPAAYDNDLRRDFELYLQQRTEFYCVEQRWPDSPFWARRQQHASVLPPAATLAV